jgi:hypothetical protein
MKNRINLFKQKPQLDFISVNAAKFKAYLTSAGVLVFILFLFLMNQVFILDTQQQDLINKKETYLKYLLDEKDIEANMRYFKSKQTQLNKFLKDDANFHPYYEVLVSSIGATSTNAVLDTIDIDKNRSTRFIVKFTNDEEMLSFLKNIESEEFLKNFVSLSLQNFTLNKQTSKSSRYELELRGVFKELAQK